jgi:cytidylate kinase
VERLTGALARAQRHWRERRQKTRPVASVLPATGFTIALMREAGALGTSVARELGARLGWPVYDHELLEHIAQETGLRVSLLESIDERRRSWLQDGLESFANVPMLSESGYVHHLIETILSLGLHGDCIIVGRGAAMILPASTTLRVRLVGALPDRISHWSRRLGISPDEAANQVHDTDRERERFIQRHFQREVSDTTLYDLVLNTSRWSVPECAEIMIESLRRLEMRAAARVS